MSREAKLPQTIADEGKAAFERDLPRRDCPYPPGANERAEWLAGWDRAASLAGVTPREPD